MKLSGTILLSVLCLLNYSNTYTQEKELQSTVLHKDLSCKVGEPIFLSEEVIKDVQVRILESFEVKSGFTRYEHQEGAIYPLRRTKKGYHLYYTQQKLIDGKYWGIGINEEDINDVIPVMVRPDGDLEKMKKYKIKDKVEFIDKYQSCSDCTRKELLYLGLGPKNIIFKYRELHGILNKVLFEEEVNAQKSEDQTLVYKGLELKIINATIHSIEYQVLKGFDKMK